MGPDVPPAYVFTGVVGCAVALWWRSPGTAARLAVPARRATLVALALVWGVATNLAVGYNGASWPGAGDLLAGAVTLALAPLALAGTLLCLERGHLLASALARPEGRERRVVPDFRDVPVALALLLATVLTRLPWLDSTGYGGDVLMYAGWGEVVARRGLAVAYASQDLTHGPVFVGATGLMAWLWRAAGLAQGGSESVPVAWIKAPGVLADGALAVLVYLYASHWWRRLAAAGLALLLVLSPGIILDSAWWGQTDSQAALWATAAVVAASAGRPALAGASTALALLTKLQAYYVAPLTAIVTWRGAPGSGPAAGLRWAAGAGATLALVCAPLLLEGAGDKAVAVYAQLVGRHPLVNVGAFNFWWLGLGWTGYALNDGLRPFGEAMPVTLRQVGIGALALYSSLVLLRLWTRYDPRDVPLAGAALAMAFFMLPTQIHSRYLFQALPLLLVAAVHRPPLVLAYLALSVTFFINQLHLIWRTPGGWPELAPLPPALAGLERLGLTPEALALTNVLVFGVLTWLLARPLVRRRDAHVATVASRTVVQATT